MKPASQLDCKAAAKEKTKAKAKEDPKSQKNERIFILKIVGSTLVWRNYINYVTKSMMWQPSN